MNRINLHAHITDSKTGETRVYHFDDEPDRFIIAFDWGDNNNSCDCNRHLKFEQAGNNPNWRDTEIECGESRFRVRIVDDAGGVVYEDKPQPRLT